MPRYPLIPIETGPIIGPALQAANVIREGRARVSVAEETARTYPEARRLELGKSAEDLAQARIGTLSKQYEFGLKQEQDKQAAEIQKLNVAKGLLDYADKIWEDADTPEEYNRRREMSIKAKPELEGLLDPLRPEHATPEGFFKAKKEQFDQRRQLDKELELERMKQTGMTEREKMQQAGADRRAKMAAEGKRDWSDLTAKDKIDIRRDARADYNMRYGDQIYDEDTNEYVWKVRPGAPKFDDEYVEQYYEKEMEAVGTGKSWRDYQGR